MSPCTEREKRGGDTLRCREFEARVCTLCLKVWARKHTFLQYISYIVV